MLLIYRKINFFYYDDDFQSVWAPKEIAVVFDKQFLNIYLFLYDYFKLTSIFFLDKEKCIHTNTKISIHPKFFKMHLHFFNTNKYNKKTHIPELFHHPYF